MISDIFKSPEQKAREIEEKELDEALAKVKFFPGTQFFFFLVTGDIFIAVQPL